MAADSAIVMRAALCSSTKPSLQANLAIRDDAAIPAIPANGGVLVHVHHASVNPVDYTLAENSFTRRLMIGSLPIIPGIDFVGQVFASTNPDFKIGDYVFGRHDGPNKNGSLAEYTVVTGEKGLAKVPHNLEASQLFQLGGVGVAGLTAYQCFKATNLPKNEPCAVFINGGSGGTGMYGVQIAKHAYGIKYVVAACSGSNAAFVKSLGADEVIDYQNTNVIQHLQDWSNRTSRKFDLIIDNVGRDPELYWQCHHYLKADGGKYIQIATDFSYSALLGLTKIMVWPKILGGKKRAFQFVTVSDNRQDLETIGRWVATGKISTIVENGNRFDLANAAAAFDKLRGGGVRGKILIKVAERRRDDQEGRDQRI